jgi:hypothetical protein
MPEEVDAEPQQPALLSANQLIADFLSSLKNASEFDASTVAAVNELYQLGRLTKRNLCRRLEENRK